MLAAHQKHGNRIARYRASYRALALLTFVFSGNLRAAELPVAEDLFAHAPCASPRREAGQSSPPLPDFLEVDVKLSKLKKWLANQIRAMADDTSYIRPKRKKKFPATVKWRVGDVICESSADVRLTGDLRDHLQLDRAVSRPVGSLAVRLHDQHINGITRFKLLLPKTRKGDNEILATLLFRELGFVTPQTWRVQARVNGATHDYLFQEIAAKELLEANGLRESVIVEGDERGMWQLHDRRPNRHFMWHTLWGFGLPDNASWIRSPAAERIALRGLSVYSRMYANHIASLPYGGIAKTIFVPDEQVLSANRWIRDESLYVLLSHYLQGSHGLYAHNRKFYFDPIYGQLRPVYYDGNIIPLSFDVDLDPAHYRMEDFDNIARLFTDPATRASLFKRYAESGGQKTRQEISALFDALAQINATFRNARRDIETRASQDSVQQQWVLAEHMQRHRLSLQRFLGFNVVRSRYQQCNVDAQLSVACEDLSAADAPEFFRDPVTSDEKPLLFLGNFEISDSGVVSFDTTPALDARVLNPSPGASTVSAGDVLWWHFDADSKPGVFDVTLEFDGMQTGKLIVSGAIPDRSTFNFGSTQAGALDFTSRFDERLLTSCVTFVDATMNDNVITSRNAPCEDGINFLRARGNVAQITIDTSAADALDADFSDLSFGTIKVTDAGNDCLDLSMGRYVIQSFDGENCGDKAVSVGEQAQATLTNVQVASALSAIVAKDSAVVSVGALLARDIDYCYQAYRKKQEFDGGLIIAPVNEAPACKDRALIQVGSELVRE